MSYSRLPLAFLVLGLLLVSSQGLTTYVYNFDTLFKYSPYYDLGYLLSGNTIMLDLFTGSANLKFGVRPFVLVNTSSTT